MKLNRILSFDHHPAVVGLVDATRGLLAFAFNVMVYRVITGNPYVYAANTWLGLMFSVMTISFIIGAASVYMLRESEYLRPLHRVRFSLVGCLVGIVVLYVPVGLVSAEWSVRLVAFFAVVALPVGAILGDRILSLRDPYGVAKLLRRGENVEAHIRLHDYKNRPH